MAADFNLPESSLDGFLGRCASALESAFSAISCGAKDEGAERAYAAALSFVTRMLAILIAAGRAPGDRESVSAIREAAEALYSAAQGGPRKWARVYENACAAAHESAQLDILALYSDPKLAPSEQAQVACCLLCPRPEAPMEPMYFETMPISWLGRAYQHMLAYRPSRSGRLERDPARRKRGGVYFTPVPLIRYVVESALAAAAEPFVGTIDGRPAKEQIASVKILDPAMGGGDFLTCAVDCLCEGAGFGDDAGFCARIASDCVFGVDVDPLVVEIARFAVWGAAGFPEGLAEPLNRHLVCADALAGRDQAAAFDWAAAFPDVFAKTDGPGFDAVVGNPPYVAAKNTRGLPLPGARGQSDYYLVFLEAAIGLPLVKRGGVVGMVVPDPMLVRGNAADIRRKLIQDWTILSLLHISEAFQDANVANVVPICRNSPPAESTFPVSRVERAAERRSFVLRPRKTAAQLARPVRRELVLAQRRAEFLYLLEDGYFAEMVCRIHGQDMSLSNYEPPFVPLRRLNVKAIFRGEEVGKSAITREEGDLPVLLGGQSIRPYEIVWEGRRAPRSWVKKPVERYGQTKILIQKSSEHLIAALDVVGRRHPGYVFPQSVYAVELDKAGMHEVYLLCILNSRLMNEYIFRTTTGYKFLHPQLEIEDIRALPIRRVNFTTRPRERIAATARGLRVFEDESLRAVGPAPFAELGNYAASCLTRSPERSDVVHDVLVHLGRVMMDLVGLDRRSPSVETTRRIEVTRAAIETVVCRLYSSDPAQMSLAL